MKIVTVGHVTAFRDQVRKCVTVGGDLLALGGPGCGKTVQAVKLWQSEQSPARPAHYYSVSEEKNGQRQALDLFARLVKNSGKSVRAGALRSAAVRLVADDLAEQKSKTLILDQFELATSDFFDDVLTAKKQAQIGGQAVSLVIFCKAIPQTKTHPCIEFDNRISMRFGFPTLTENDVSNLLKEWFGDECSDLHAKYEEKDKDAREVVRLITSQFSGRVDYIAQFAALHRSEYASQPWTRDAVIAQIKEFSGLDPQPELVLKSSQTTFLQRLPGFG